MADLKLANRGKLVALAPLALALALGACNDDDDGMAPTPTPTMSPAPSPSPTPTTGTLDVTQCLTQEVAPGTAVADLVVPDVINVAFGAPSGFPNGRDLDDQVIDVTLAVIFLDLSADGQGATTLAGLPLNPPSNDVSFRASFPYLAQPQGDPPVADGSGMSFSFRTDAPSAYTRVDRMGMPAVSTALVPSGAKLAYNDANPAVDATGEFVDELSGQLATLATALDDDLRAAGLVPCAQ